MFLYEYNNKCKDNLQIQIYRSDYFMKTLNTIAKELMELRTSKKMLAEKEKALMNELKQYFPQDNSKQNVETNDYFISRYPALTGTRYDLEAVRKLAIKNHIKLMERTYTYKVLEDKLAELVGDILSNEEFEGLKIQTVKFKINKK